MNLAIDIGNSFTKIAVFKQKEIIHFLSVKHASEQDYQKLFQNFKIEKCILSSVRKLKQEDFNFFPDNIHVHIMDAHTRLPFKNLYESPETLGNDRKALAAAAISLFPGENILVISAGTAITYEVIDEHGQYLGGAISPGLNLRFKALNTFTGKLPLVHYNYLNDFIGKNTDESIASGVATGINGEMEHYIRLCESKFKKLRIIMTGGDSKHFDKNLKNNIFAIPNLVLVGLNEIMEFNA